jgi:hypothetical protein
MQDTFQVLHACIVHLFLVLYLLRLRQKVCSDVLLYPTQTHKCDSPFAIVLALINSFVSRLNSLQDINKESSVNAKAVLATHEQLFS